MRVVALRRWLLVSLCLLLTSCGDTARVEGPLALAPVAPSASAVATTYTLVTEPRAPLLDPSRLTTSLLILPLVGGNFSVLGHTLKVPVGAVLTPTIFTMTVLPTGYIEVDLTAVLPDLFGTVVTSFAKPIRLTLTYRRTTDVIDPSRLVIVHVDGSTYTPVPSVVDASRKTVKAKLTHFSKYAMAQN